MSEQRIRELAYQLWQQRGSPLGSPEVDWFRAEEQILRAVAAEHPRVLIVIARALGSVAGILVAFFSGFR